ncbi:hypothetical protein LNO10_27185 [Klebsiella variicola subsp. variicola]|nr:hypothetical protein [Klebsiella variicola subsp. variicola]
MDKRYELADKHGMSHEFIDWFFDKKKDGYGNLWFVMMSAMWEGYKARDTHSRKAFAYHQEQEIFEAWWEQNNEGGLSLVGQISELKMGIMTKTLINNGRPGWAEHVILVKTTDIICSGLNE